MLTSPQKLSFNALIVDLERKKCWIIFPSENYRYPWVTITLHYHS